MKKVLLAVIAAAMVFCAQAQESKEILSRYGKEEGAMFLTLDKKSFNMMKPLLGLDKDTRKLLNILNLKSIDILQTGPASSSEEARKELAALKEKGLYKSTLEESGEKAEEGADCLYLTEGEKVVDFIIYSRSPKNSSLMVMRIECDAEMAKMKEFIAAQKH